MKRMIVSAALSLASATAMAQSGWYVGGAFGQSEAKGICSGLPAGTSCDDSEVTLKAMGGYQFTRNFALEVGLTGAGEYEAGGPLGRTTTNIGIAEGVALGILPLGDKFSVFGKVGLYSANVETETNTVLTSRTEDKRSSDLTYGLGLGFAITPKLLLRAEWQRYQDVQSPDLSKSDVDIMTLGMVYRFF